MHAGDHAGGGELMDGLACLAAVGPGVDQLHLAGVGDEHLGGAVHVAVGMAGQGDGLFPGLHQRIDAVNEDRGAENRTVENAADGGVGALVHLLQIELLHPLQVRGDGGALDGHAVLLGSHGRVDGHLILGRIPGTDGEVVVLLLQLHKGLHPLSLDLFPEDTGHFVSIHLHDGCGHFNFIHSVCSNPCKSSGDVWDDLSTVKQKSRELFEKKLIQTANPSLQGPVKTLAIRKPSECNSGFRASGHTGSE